MRQSFAHGVGVALACLVLSGCNALTKNDVVDDEIAVGPSGEVPAPPARPGSEAAGDGAEQAPATEAPAAARPSGKSDIEIAREVIARNPVKAMDKDWLNAELARRGVKLSEGDS